ncbi:hypothetical protein [Rhodococcus koreensis]|uniref:hypothetical protein n=1 Tax=Rhodococcus koreensis TaxID=99653 RepID=UPI0036D82F71
MGHSDIHKVLHGMFNDRDFDAMDAQLDTTIAYEDVPRGLTLHDAAEFKDWLRGWTTAFSGARIDAAQYLDGSDFSVSLLRGTGSNDGPFGPPPADKPGDGRPALRGHALRLGRQGALVPDLLRPGDAAEPAGPHHTTGCRVTSARNDPCTPRVLDAHCPDA